MNERIKELIKSLGIIPEDEHYEVAELIVRECAGLVNEQLQHNNPNDSLLALKIKEHFGVE